MKLLPIFFCFLVLQACKHPLAIEGEGDIVERLAGVRGCTLEDFQASSSRCAENEVTEESYTVSYEAIPRPGWVFTGWEGTACETLTDEGYCSYDVGQALVDLTDMTWPGIALPSTTAVFKLPAEAAIDVFAAEVAGPVLSSRCMACHIEGGISGHTRLVFDHLSSAEQNAYNIDAFQNFVDTVDDGREYLLTKVRGGNGHGGGSVFSAASDEYVALASFLSLLEGAAPTGDGGPDTNSFWEGINIADAQTTLRRAALILAGRLPTQSEIASAETGDAGLRSAIRGLMSGDGFHNFLIQGANDRLLTEALFDSAPFDVIGAGADSYPVMANREHEFFEAGVMDEYNQWRAQFTFGFARAPLELIAFVVENDRPYTEILTADYTMVNRGSAEIVRADDVQFPDEPDWISALFKPAKNRGQVFRDESYVQERFVNGSIQIQGHSGFVDYPHAGILSEPAFLGRYPTTETNRNRARARWTYYHFLGVDIEKSAGRTQDPLALADNNNPTLNNPNCAVCHQLHDPVAGTFQDFGDEGWYRLDGKDSLPANYKWPENGDSPYQWGDLWFRDMRLPGFEGQYAPAGTSSIQWLAQTIIEDPRFASAAVKFWWPALIGSDPVAAPEVTADADFDARLNQFERQQDDISQIAEHFRSGTGSGNPYNLKDLLVELVMSSWFRAEGATQALSETRSVELSRIGVRRLLTPQELEAKTYALMGVRWDEYQDLSSPGGRVTGLNDAYNIYYGGIDSNGITERARELTPLMANVAQAHALQTACALVLEDINRPDAERVLFKSMSRTMTPDTHESDIRSKLAVWHKLLLGESVVANSTELNASYDLLVALWEARREQNSGTWAWDYDSDETCFLPDNWWEEHEDDAAELADDPEKMLGAWISTLVYFMTDFRYLHE